ncbi:laccase-15-like [Telopea speciosissima]|uniref:laccase-15-like n=1 Tax=Telopea speciosissima TaxID=54955 RepID=UPI001CC5FED2|nr:laccase-15-like [Telopea speciosissima]
MCLRNMSLILQLLGLILLLEFFGCNASAHYTFVIEKTPYTRLCSTKNILTVNRQFPGPPLFARKGETVIVDVINKANDNITIHWHGVRQPRSPWWDGPAYVTQCPIKPGSQFRYKVIFTTEEGTLWWHAHADWTRATVHGPIVIFPKVGSTYPFPKPYEEMPIVLGEWWKRDVAQVYRQLLRTGGDPNVSDAFTINGQPGDLYPCSKQGTFRLSVQEGKTYLLRIINAGMNDNLFFAIAQHKLTVVSVDARYTKPLTRDYIVIPPGQTIDALLVANQSPNHYYMAARAYSSGQGVIFDNTTTTAILQYSGHQYTPSSFPSFPYLPFYNDTASSVSFTGALRSLASKDHPAKVPLMVDTQLISTISVNTFPCRSINNSTCQGPNGTRFAASMNNITYRNPSVSILQAYYKDMIKVFGESFPNRPPLIYNFTGDFLPQQLQTPMRGTEVKLLDYNSTMEIVLQGTNLVAGEDHPMHLHGHSFYVVGWGFGNFDKNKDPLRYNLIDPPFQNTALVPKKGWIAIRFRADNPGVWFMHCHLERHLTWGMDTVLITKNGLSPRAQLVPPPADLPPC